MAYTGIRLCGRVAPRPLPMSLGTLSLLLAVVPLGVKAWIFVSLCTTVDYTNAL